MSLPLSDVAQLVGGKLSGDGAIAIYGAAILRDARRGDLTLIDKPRLLKQLAACEASAILCPSGLEIDGRPSVAVDDVHACFATDRRAFPATTGRDRLRDQPTGGDQLDRRAWSRRQSSTLARPLARM